MHILGGIAAVLGVFVLLLNGGLYAWRAFILRRVKSCEQDETFGMLHTGAAFLEDCAALAASIGLIPAGWFMTACAEHSGTRGGVVLLHDWGLNRGALWWLRRRLLRAGWTPICCTAYNAFSGDIAAAADRLRDSIETIAPAVVIGHGVGGLVARYFARHHPSTSVRRIVTLGTPHRGTLLSPPGGLRQLAPDSPLLRDMTTGDHVPQEFDVIAIQSRFDATILPPMNAEYPRAFNIRVSGVGHYALLFSPKVYRLLIENLEAPLG